jgi:hypothetical protein
MVPVGKGMAGSVGPPKSMMASRSAALSNAIYGTYSDVTVAPSSSGNHWA